MQLHLNDKGEIAVSRKDWGQTDAFSDNAGWTNLLGGPIGQSHAGVEVNPITALQTGAVYACIRILCNDLSKLPLRLMRQDNDGLWTEDRAHPLARLIRRPNKRMTTYDMVVQWVMSLCLTGNSYSALLTDDAGRPTDIVPLLPSTVSVREDGRGNLFYYTMSRLLAHRHDNMFGQDEMLHIRTMSLDGGIRGAAPTALCSEIIGLGIATQQLAASMFKNGGHFHGYLTTDNTITPDAIKLVSDTWTNNITGLRNGYKTPVLGYGFKFNPANLNPEQAQLVEARKQITEEIARVFGVPLYKLGGNEKSSYSAIDAQSQEYIDSTLIPLTTPIEQCLNRTLLYSEEHDNHRFEFDFSALERGDLKTRSDYWHTLLGDGVVNVNEYRKTLNMKGIGPDGDIFTKPVNTGVVGDAQALPNYQVSSQERRAAPDTVPAP